MAIQSIALAPPPSVCVVIVASCIASYAATMILSDERGTTVCQALKDNSVRTCTLHFGYLSITITMKKNSGQTMLLNCSDCVTSAAEEPLALRATAIMSKNWTS